MWYCQYSSPSVSIIGILKATLLIGIVSTNWSVVVQLHVAVSILLAFGGACIVKRTKEANMMKAVAKAISLMVGTALPGRPVWRHVSNFRRVSAHIDSVNAI